MLESKYYLNCIYVLQCLNIVAVMLQEFSFNAKPYLRNHLHPRNASELNNQNTIATMKCTKSMKGITLIICCPIRRRKGSFIKCETLSGIYRICLMNRNLIPNDNSSTEADTKQSQGKLFSAMEIRLYQRR